ncbi:MAG: ABC transporter substrate-binding protein [Pseudomonadota bacterium]|nr:ABC transporter substrate-binding protein [Pseudomonadota bacterium]
MQAEVLKVATSGNISTLLNPFCCLVQGIINPHAMMHDTLFSISTDGKLNPELAISAEFISNNKWIIKLRPNVTYSNGRPFNSDAVIKNINYLKSPEAQKFVMSAETRTIKNIRSVDLLTLEIETYEPDVLLDRRLSTILLPEPWLYEELGPENFNKDPVGTGSFKLENWNLNSQRPVLIKNDTSWRPSLEINRVEIRVVKDATSLVQALLSEIVDLGTNFGITELGLLSESEYNIITRPGGIIAALALSNSKPPFKDIRVRQAINYAVDKVSIAEIIMAGITKPSGQPGVLGMSGFDSEIKPYPYNPKKAKELLDEAGYQNGFDFKAEVLITGGVTEAASMYQKIAQDLSNVGVVMNVQPLQGPQWISKYFSGNWGKADSISATWNSAAYWDVIRAIEIFSCKKPGAFFCIPELMREIDATHSMFSREKRSVALKELSKKMHDLAPSLFLIEIVDIIALKKKFYNTNFRHKQLAVEKLRVK